MNADAQLTIDPNRPRHPQARRAGSDDIPRMSVSLSRAFADDPVQMWMLPRARRRVRMAALFALMLGFQVPLAETYSTSDCVGAAVWAPPGRWRLDLDAMAASAEQSVAIFGPNVGHAIDTVATMEGSHPREPEHWYLTALGTHPDWQGQGIGSALMRPVLSRADEEGVPAYLESSKERNIVYYNRFGFEVTGEIRLPGGGPTLWSMWREPQRR